ncbi:MAG: RdgB/HAM1 family non-canonical purine NTP pyrophosphatase [Tepidisphaeraceae bacterium]
MKILIASTNRGKVREFRQILADGGVAEFTDLTEHAELPAVEETGSTFLANACLKAGQYAKLLEMWSLADDSGLAVDALEGKPGVFSARWAAMHKAGEGDADNNALLLRQLAGLPAERRTARFVCAVALADPRGRVVLTASDSVEGRILAEPRGHGGFGYDPLFLVEALGKTTGELPAEEKHRISHRGKALRRLAALMERTGLPLSDGFNSI